ncbi:hypothetical protein DNU06_03455 [Putridiphycobacter roseus]|uniref:DUF3108 domain-containing protein n=1 Tax=Putridiphycobacter roseus TaxID=2219161 RepID=A0A2W1N3J3_9FLAO|nr:hypothetical protein [Putridiphycobacter roseus]PZE18897.1 hypothetical protein DNU06_03455 [Putridiphycobacter roseus]
MKFSTLLLIVLSFIGFSFTSNLSSEVDSCDSYFPLKEGLVWKTESFDKKGKSTGTNQMTVLGVSYIDDAMNYTIESEYQVTNKDEVQKTELTYVCKNGVLTLDFDDLMKNFGGLEESSPDMEVKITGAGMEIPANLATGDILAETNIGMNAFMNGMKIMGGSVRVYERKVEAMENVTTAAGTFECAKITSKTYINMGFVKSTTSSIEWISKKAGMVKSEQYDKKGKFAGHTELVEYKN